VNAVDFIPDKEFNELFNRISKKVSLEGASTPARARKGYKNQDLNRGLNLFPGAKIV